MVLQRAEYFPTNKKTNPTRNELLKSYDMMLTLSGGASAIVDRCGWENKGAGRDWYAVCVCVLLLLLLLLLLLVA